MTFSIVTFIVIFAAWLATMFGLISLAPTIDQLCSGMGPDSDTDWRLPREHTTTSVTPAGSWLQRVRAGRTVSQHERSPRG